MSIIELHPGHASFWRTTQQLQRQPGAYPMQHCRTALLPPKPRPTGAQVNRAVEELLKWIQGGVPD